MFETFLGECLMYEVGRIIVQVMADDPTEQIQTEWWTENKGFKKDQGGLYVLNLEP